LQTRSEFSEFLAFPELIPAKKRSMQQPLLDYTQSRILTSREYISGMEQVLAQKEATIAATKRKKEEKEANKEQRKIEKEELQKQKQDRVEARVARKRVKDLERHEKVAAAGARGRQRRGAIATAAQVASEEAVGGRGLNVEVPPLGAGDVGVSAARRSEESPDLRTGCATTWLPDLHRGGQIKGDVPCFSFPLQGSTSALSPNFAPHLR
jgi:hypothetical protein